MHIDLPSLNLSVDRPITISGGLGATIHVLEGQIWLTEEDQLEDRFVACGQSYALQSAGRVVVDSSCRARILVESPVSVESARPLPARVGDAWRQFTHWLQVTRHPLDTPAFVK